MNTIQKEQRYLLPIYHRYPLEVESGRGCWLFDSDGNAYLDAMSGIGVNALGYAHPRITDILAKQATLAVHTSNYVYHRYQGELAERLCSLSGLDRAFFCNSGTEAMEAALKAVRARGRSLHSKKTHLVALQRSFHGRTFGSLAVMGQPAYRQCFEPLGADVTFVEPNDCTALANAVSKETAGVVLEPILGEGGIVPLNPEFLKLARKLATETEALLVLDEIQCGLGRTGRYFAYEWAGIHPDIVTLAKPLAAGLPLGATLFTDHAAEALTDGTHGTTFGGGPLACRVALEFLDSLESLLPRISALSTQLFRDLHRLQGKHGSMLEIRGNGLMIGIEMSRAGRPIVEGALNHGLLINCTQETVLRLLPPYILTEEEATQIVQRLDAALVATG